MFTVSFMESSISSISTCSNESGIEVCLAIICAYVKSVPKKSFVIMVIPCGFLSFNRSANTLLSSPPDNAIHSDSHSAMEFCNTNLH